MRNRTLLAVALAAGLAVSVSASACSSDDDASSSPTTVASDNPTTTMVGNVLPPVILTESDASANVKVGTTVTFDLGDPGEGRFVAQSADPKVFRVDGEGKNEGTYTTNAGGMAVAAGTTEVTVQFFGSTNGVGSPTTFTITVE
jgi:hypothetical protein